MSTSPQKSEGRITTTPSPSNIDDVQKVAEIKEYLEAKISDLEAELVNLKDMLVLVDTTLREKSFVPAIALRGSSTTIATKAQAQKPTTRNDNESKTGQLESPKMSATATKTSPENPNERQLRRTKDSILLANALIDQSKVVIVPSKEIKISQHTPPFQSFFVNRILRGYQSKDEEDSKNGKLKPNEILQYNVQETQGSISSVTVSNYRDNARLNEILSTITWAFTRMLEKK
jgi:hypothetical protein